MTEWKKDNFLVKIQNEILFRKPKDITRIEDAIENYDRKRERPDMHEGYYE